VTVTDIVPVVVVSVDVEMLVVLDEIDVVGSVVVVLDSD